MLARGGRILEQARAQRRAVAGFSTYTLESTRAICAAAEARGRPVIVQVSAGAFAASSFEMLTAAVLAAAAACAVPVGVHLDHSRDLEEIRACLAAGFTSVMVDGSHLPLAANVELTRTVTAEARDAGAWVEAELGPIAGNEHASRTAEAGALTDPGEAAEFVAATGVDLLAAAVGTVHGLATTGAGLDTDRIAAITAATGIGLALHGASGLSAAQLRAAVGAGVVKVNINTELRRAHLAAVSSATRGASDDVTAVMRAATEAMSAVAAERIDALDRASGPEKEVT